MASLSETTDISNAYTNGVIPVQKAGTLKGINVNNNGFYQYFTIDGEQYINSCSNFVANTFTGWNKFDVDTLTTLEQVTASTDVSKPVGAGAVQELNSSLVANIYVGEDGKLHKVQGGADSVLPFSGGYQKVSGKFTTVANNWANIDLGFKPKILFITCGALYDESISETKYVFGSTTSSELPFIDLGSYYSSHSKAGIDITDVGFKFHFDTSNYTYNYIALY